MTDSLKNYDSTGRMGGKEFLVITSTVKGTDCIDMFDRLRMRIAENKIRTRSKDLCVTVSIGVACATAGNTLDKILEAADEALYRAKDGGRNRVSSLYEQSILQRRAIPADPDF